MFDKLLVELTAMNGNAKALLEKYDNAGIKLDTKVEILLQSIVNAGLSGLEALQEVLASGNIAQAENALKLGGKTLDEIKKEINIPLLDVSIDSHVWIVPDGFGNINLSDIFPINEGSKYKIEYKFSASCWSDDIGQSHFQRFTDKNGNILCEDSQISYTYNYGEGEDHGMYCTSSSSFITDATELNINFRKRVDKSGYSNYQFSRGNSDDGMTGGNGYVRISEVF